MNLYEDISRIKQMMGFIKEDNSKKDLSPMIRESLNSFIERNKHIVCDIEVTAPWNRETIEPDKSFKHYKVLVTFIGGYGTKYFPTTQAVQGKYDNLMDEIWETVYGFFGEPTDVYSKKVKKCDNVEKEEQTEGKDPKTGTGKKPKGSGRRLYTDENPSDTVSVKFRTKEDIVDTLNKDSFKSKPHKRQSQIINLIHQRVRAAYQNAKDPETKKRLKRAYDYIENVKEKSKEKTIKLQEQEKNEGDSKQTISNVKRRLNHIDNAFDYFINKVYTLGKICNFRDANEFIYVVFQAVVERMYNYSYSDIDDNSGEWAEMYLVMEKYFKQKYGHMIKEYYEQNCIKKQEQNEGELTEKCWKGYTQKGMKTMFGKRYPNCVKKTK